MDWERMHKPENLELHYRRNGSYPTHFALFGEEHGYFCKYRPPPALILWGRYDVYFDVVKAQGYGRVLPQAVIHSQKVGTRPWRPILRKCCT